MIQQYECSSSDSQQQERYPEFSQRRVVHHSQVSKGKYYQNRQNEQMMQPKQRNMQQSQNWNQPWSEQNAGKCGGSVREFQQQIQQSFATSEDDVQALSKQLNKLTPNKINFQGNIKILKQKSSAVVLNNINHSCCSNWKGCHISVGPDCTFLQFRHLLAIDWTLIIGFTVILSLSLLLLYYTFKNIPLSSQTSQSSQEFTKIQVSNDNSSDQNLDDSSKLLTYYLSRITSVILAIWVTLTYLLTALSDPGIYKSQLDPGPKHKYCNVCQAPMSKSVRHCARCNVCIIGHDHHCPWMSKCIGKGNIRYFYGFVGSVPLLIVYFWLVLFVGLKNQQKVK